MKTKTRNIPYYSVWTGSDGVSHHSIEMWNDTTKWSWNLVKDYKFENMSYKKPNPNSVDLNTRHKW